MPIVDLQRQMRELGRIRIGAQVPVGTAGKTRPSKLDSFRLTSASRPLIDAAAAAYGGTVAPWGEGEFEVITTTDVLDIIVPPGQAVSQYYELWSGGGCQRRCDGVTMLLTMEKCLCPADPEDRRAGASANPPTACKPTTRLNVMLPALPDLGVWRLESHGFYAAVELAGAADILSMASAAGRLIPARLRLEQRTKKVPGKPINRYAVPVIEFVETRIGDLDVPLMGRGEAPALGPGRRTVPELPATTLPDASDLRAPSPPDPRTGAPERIDRSAIAAALDVPVEHLPADPVGMVEQLAAAQSGFEPEGIEQADLIARLNAAHVPLADAIAAAKQLFPDRPDDVPLTPSQRLTLWRSIEATLASSAL